jgi:hypothetical protein
MRFLISCTDKGMIAHAKYVDESFVPGPNDIFVDNYEDLDNSYVDLSTKTLRMIPPAPSKIHKFDYDKKEWVLSIADARTDKWAKIKKERDAAEFGGFTWGEYAFDSDALSQQRISSAVQLAGLDPEMSLEWTLADNSTHVFTAAEYIEIGKALANHVTAIHERGRIARSQVESAKTIDQVEKISWQTIPTT